MGLGRVLWQDALLDANRPPFAARLRTIHGDKFVFLLFKFMYN